MRLKIYLKQSVDFLTPININFYLLFAAGRIRYCRGPDLARESILVNLCYKAYFNCCFNRYSS